MDPLSGREAETRYQKIDKTALLSLCSLFAGLSPWEIKSISQLTRLVEFRKDEIVYREGGEAEAFYVVVSGRFEASVQPSGKKKVLAYLRRGDYFGEMSLLTDEAHSATISALSDSLILELKKEDFKKIVEHNATVALELGRRLSVRLKGGVDTRSKLLLKSDLISVFSGQPKIGRSGFSLNLAASLVSETNQKTVLLNIFSSDQEGGSAGRLGPKTRAADFYNIESAPSGALLSFMGEHSAGFYILNILHDEKDLSDTGILIPLLNHLSVDFRFILIDLPANLDETSFKILTQSDSVYFVTDSHINNISEIKEVIADLEKNYSFPKNHISVAVQEVFYGVRTTIAIRKELFGERATYSLPSPPSVENEYDPGAKPLVLENQDSEYSRVMRHIARRISNNLVGVALGSGAALGLAHIGVLKILERENIPIDMVAGSSIGALIGSLYAVRKDILEVERAALEINSRLRVLRLLDINIFPVRALMDSNRVLRHFRSHLGNKTFEDCRVPLKVAGANLSTRQTHIFDSGLIADAVRTSIAIPAIFNPSIMGGDTVVDGGILNPLPIRALREAGANKIIAVNVFPTHKDILEKRIVRQELAEDERVRMQQRGPILQMGYRLKKAATRVFFPNLFDILMNTIQSMESEIAEIECEAADLVLRPVVPTASWVDFYKPKIFIQKGEEETMRIMPKIKALVSHQNL